MKQGTTGTKNLRWYMRYLHNKIGFFIVGLVIIYGLTGLLQTYRYTNLLKHEVVHKKQLAPNLSDTGVGISLRLPNFKVTKIEGNVRHFQDGAYNAATGAAIYSTKEWYAWLVPFIELHTTSTESRKYYFTTLFGVALLFMSVSAFWMFKPGTKPFSSGVYLTIAGIVASIILILLK
ncbi:hypothetical protein [Segetibacter sp.]|jgi:hypothetical protein|uniref:hypothetical protein n=1 Tax=Segetibacter sp. TaxID=2231182 RepID=UPI002625A735|nr:hypothetical protein [Segetibacter sp.]MCW3079805.1 rane protein [Segetibacter sp.]